MHGLPTALVPVSRPGQVLIATAPLARQALTAGLFTLESINVARCPEQLREAFPRKRRSAPRWWL